LKTRQHRAEPRTGHSGSERNDREKVHAGPIEAVVRGYLTGVTDTAIWTRYSKGQRIFAAAFCPTACARTNGCRSDIDPTTKETLHDRALTREEMIAQGFITVLLFDTSKRPRSRFFLRQELAARNGLLLVDTKYEFGTDENGELMLIDEIHTPDSSPVLAGGFPMQPRLWRERSRIISTRNFFGCGSRITPTRTRIRYCRKRRWNSSRNLSRRYIQMFEQITGNKFEYGATPAFQRIERNLRPYAFESCAALPGHGSAGRRRSSRPVCTGLGTILFDCLAISAFTGNGTRYSRRKISPFDNSHRNDGRQSRRAAHRNRRLQRQGDYPGSGHPVRAAE